MDLTEREASFLAGNSFVMGAMGAFIFYVLGHSELMIEQPVFAFRGDKGQKTRSFDHLDASQ